MHRLDEHVVARPAVLAVTHHGVAVLAVTFAIAVAADAHLDVAFFATVAMHLAVGAHHLGHHLLGAGHHPLGVELAVVVGVELVEHRGVTGHELFPGDRALHVLGHGAFHTGTAMHDNAAMHLDADVTVGIGVAVRPAHHDHLDVLVVGLV